MYVASDNALKIEDPSLENSGHYSCSALNDVGSALARSHLVIYDPKDFGPKVRKARLFFLFSLFIYVHITECPRIVLCWGPRKKPY